MKKAILSLCPQLRGHEDAHENGCKRGKHGVVSVGACDNAKQRHEQVTRCDGVRRSKRVAERMAEAEHDVDDVEHAHKRGRHESVTKSVHGSVEPWRDK